MHDVLKKKRFQLSNNDEQFQKMYNIINEKKTVRAKICTCLNTVQYS